MEDESWKTYKQVQKAVTWRVRIQVPLLFGDLMWGLGLPSIPALVLLLALALALVLVLVLVPVPVPVLVPVLALVLVLVLVPVPSTRT